MMLNVSPNSRNGRVTAGLPRVGTKLDEIHAVNCSEPMMLARVGPSLLDDAGR
jgi:hypothetical protein